jgi:hypothetical protein
MQVGSGLIWLGRVHSFAESTGGLTYMHVETKMVSGLFHGCRDRELLGQLGVGVGWCDSRYRWWVGATVGIELHILFLLPCSRVKLGLSARRWGGGAVKTYIYI